MDINDARAMEAEVIRSKEHALKANEDLVKDTNGSIDAFCRKNAAAGDEMVTIQQLNEDACGGPPPHLRTSSASNLRVLCEHLHLPKVCSSSSRR